MCQQLCDLPTSKLDEKLNHFSSSLRGTREYWKKIHSKLIDMITEFGCLTLFYTLTTTNTKWYDLHILIPLNNDCHRQNEDVKKTENVIEYPDIIANDIHQRINIFSELVLHKYIGARDFWYRFILVLFCHVVQDLETILCCCWFIYLNCMFIFV